MLGNREETVRVATVSALAYEIEAVLRPRSSPSRFFLGLGGAGAHLVDQFGVLQAC